MTANEQEFLERLSETVKDAVSEALGARDDRPMLTLEQAAERIGISKRSVQAMTDADPPQLASLRVGPKKWSRVVEPAEVDRYLEEQRRAGRV